MLSAVVPFLHNLMAQVGLAQELKEHLLLLLHSLECSPGTKPFLSLLCLEGWQEEISSLCCNLDPSSQKERERDWEGQAEENACRSVPAMEHKVEHNMETHL